MKDLDDPDFGKDNKIFTREKAEAARKCLIEKLDRINVTTETESALEGILQRTAARLRQLKGHSGDFIGNGIPANAFEALCVLYREYRLEDLENAGPFIRKLKQVLNEEFEKLPAAEKNALNKQALYDIEHTEYKPYLSGLFYGAIMPQYLFAEFEQYLYDFTSDRIQAAYYKWIESDWGPQPCAGPEDVNF